MNNITAVILTSNESEVLAECLKSLNFIGKIIVVDSKSTDKTIEIARKYHCIVFEHEFRNFSEARNFALKQVKTDWILYIDADERITSKLADSIIKTVSGTDRYSAYNLIRQNYYLGKQWPYQEKITRLFKKEKLEKWYGLVHESPQVNGEIGILDGFLNHHTHRSLRDMVAKTNKWSGVEAKLLFNAKHPPVTWWRLIRVFLTGFYRYFIKQKGYLVGSVGLIESIYQGFSLFITYTKLWEMQKTK